MPKETKSQNKAEPTKVTASSADTVRPVRYDAVYRFQMLIVLMELFAGMAVCWGYIFNGSLRVAGELVCLGVMVLISVFLIREILRRFHEQVLLQAVSLGTEFQQYMNQWEYPYALFSSSLHLVWQNEAFRKLMKYEDCVGRSLSDLGIDWGQEKPDWDPISRQIELEGHAFRAVMTQIRLRDKAEPTVDTGYTQVFSLSLQDITKELRLERENRDQQSVVMLLYVDNYDQVVGGMDDNERPLLEAQLFRRLSDLSSSLNGILTMIERDRYQIVFPRKSLDFLTNGQFHILEEVKHLETFGKYQITLSIGVGIDPAIEKARSYARAGVDLAMGRGGDQAVIRGHEGEKIYGGMSASVENTTRVKVRLTGYALKELIEASDHVLVMGHANPDLDCFGADLGMYRAAKELKKPVHIVMSATQHPAVEYLYNRVAQSPDYKGVLIDHEEALGFCGQNTLLVLVDVSRRVILQYPDLTDQVGNLVIIDHHRLAEDAVSGAAISYVEPYASSASEMVTELLQYMLENIHLSRIEADGLFAGIALDSQNFTMKTGVRTFEAAAYLRRQGADSVRVRKMFKSDLEDSRAKARIIYDAQIVDGHIAIASWQSDLPNATTVAAQAADELMDIHGITASFVLTELPEERINISARSLGEINVQVIMEQFGGGGHMSVAGAQLKDVSMEEAKKRLLAAIQDLTDKNAIEVSGSTSGKETAGVSDEDMMPEIET